MNRLTSRGFRFFALYECVDIILFAKTGFYESSTPSCLMPLREWLDALLDEDYLRKEGFLKP